MLRLPRQQKPNHSLTKFLVIYFKFAFVLCVCPFWLRKTENGYFKLEKSLIQGIVCAFLTILVFLQIIAIFRTTFAYSLQEMSVPLRYFVLLNIIFVYCFYIVSVFSFWFLSSQFLEIVNCIQGNANYFPDTPLFVS